MKNKKKLTVMLAAICLTAAVGAGASLAYFTDTAQAVNTVKMGHVDITLTENKVHYDPEIKKWVQDGADEITSEGLIFTDVYPGMTVPKNPTVKLVEGSADAYIRVKLEVETKDSTLTDEDIGLLETALAADIEKGNWYKAADGYYYYSLKLDAASRQAVLFETVKIPSDWQDNTAEQQFNITLQAEAIQSDYFTPERMDAGDETSKITGWYDLDGNEIVAETYENSTN